MDNGFTQIMHMVPTVDYRCQSKQGEQLISIESSGEPTAISPRFAHVMPSSNKSSTDQMIDLGIRDSRLTNIVLDDFRKQVKGLEM